jgi:hypothetical protein
MSQVQANIITLNLSKSKLTSHFQPFSSIVLVLLSLNMFSIFHFTTVLAWFTYFIAGTLAANVNTTSIPFRIMALGASVTFGIGSTTGDSYRKDLQDLLVANGNTVEFVGSKRNGNFSDNAVEAVPGFVIGQIKAAANASVSLRSLRLGCFLRGDLD